MLPKLFVISCCIAISFAKWQAPTRCAVATPGDNPAADPIEAKFVASIQDAAAQLKQSLQDTYQVYTFVGEPVIARPIENAPGCGPDFFNLMALTNCEFDIEPKVLHSVDCGAGACELDQTVSTVNTYNADRCYDLDDYTFIWGTKLSSKNKSLFEMGGEEIDNQEKTYTCTYTKDRTTTAPVKCSNPGATSGQLQLYNIGTDMKCELGYMLMARDTRNGRTSASFPMSALTFQDKEELRYKSQAVLRCASMILDTDTLSIGLYNKIMEKVPNYNSYTDLFQMTPETVTIWFYKQMSFRRDCYKAIPFTGLDGNSANQFACAME